MHGIDLYWSGQLLDGTPGTNQTLDWMAALVRRDAGNLSLRNHALSVVAGCEGHDFLCEVQTLYRHIRDGVTYRRDPIGVEWVQDATRTLFVFGSGDCDDKVVALATLLATLGHRSRFVVLGKTKEKFTHVYLEALTPKGWVALDPTPEKAHAGWQARGAIRSTYEIFGGGEKATALPFLLIGLFLWWVLK